MGSVIERGCEQWRDALAMHVFGDLPASEESALLAHLEGCADCQALLRELTETYSQLEFVDTKAIAATASVSTDLSERVLGDLRRSGHHQRRVRTIRVASVASLGAVAASLIFVALFTGNTTAPPAQRTMALRGAPSVKAGALLIAQPWGTTVKLHERGLPSGTLYTVSMETAKGTWWTAGTYRSVTGKTVNATMACAVAMHRITDVEVVNSAGVTVLSSYH